MSLELTWLPELPDWKASLEAARQQPPELAWNSFERLAKGRMDFVRAGQLDKTIARYKERHGNPAGLPVVRLALLGSGTLSHLSPGIRLGALRRGLLAEIHVGAYGMYRQELADTDSSLYQFRPQVICFSFDAEHLAPAEGANRADTLAALEYCWQTAQTALSAAVIQQTILPRFPLLMGGNEHRLVLSQASAAREINEAIRAKAASSGIAVLSVDTAVALDGLASWFDPALWYSAKQEVHPRASIFYGDLLGRLLGALRGRSAKCLVLDLDNTLWGGVIGDDGLEGIALGQGSAAGEAFVAMQRYAQQLARRGVILAVCSKNTHEVAVAAFDTHPEMVLRRSDIACFVANWQDKATNLRHIAETLNIGLDALVFVDDNPAERQLIRRELPMVHVPELPEEPAAYVACLSVAGYFEAIELSAEDAQRTALYRANAEREAVRQSSTDLQGYLEGLKMQLVWDMFAAGGQKRIAQLINKTNQFNLTTKRYTEAEVASIASDPDAVTMQLRLTDVHGDNGMIGVVIGYRQANGTLLIDTWLMSCRVLGRGVEQATLNLLCQRAIELHCTSLIGIYKPTAKNGMVREHYGQLGFELISRMEDGTSDWNLPLERFEESRTPMSVVQGETCKTLVSTNS